MWILFEELEVVSHSFAEVFIDDLGILPPPFRIQMCVADGVKRRLLAQVRQLRALCGSTASNEQQGEQHRADSGAKCGNVENKQTSRFPVEWFDRSFRFVRLIPDAVPGTSPQLRAPNRIRLRQRSPCSPEKSSTLGERAAPRPYLLVGAQCCISSASKLHFEKSLTLSRPVGLTWSAAVNDPKNSRPVTKCRVRSTVV